MKNVELTETQKQAYDFILSYIKEHGYSPSLRDVANGIYVSKPVALRHITALTKKGYIMHTPKIARSIVIKKIS